MKLTYLFPLVALTFAPIAAPAVSEAPQDFRQLAKQSIPAVVAVKVQTDAKKKSSMYNPFDSNSAPSENDFWLRFFGLQGGDAQPISGQASGFIVSPDGYIITNRHVVNGFDNIKVMLTNGQEYDAKVIAEDNYTDVAVIKIEGKNLPYLKLGNSDNLEVGQWVAAIGNPFGLSGSLSVGVVSALGRNHLDIARFEDFIQTDAAINMGNSGGPLMNLNDEVVGINTAIATRSGGYMGIGFAIPSNIAKQVLDQAMSGGKLARGYLGVTMQDIDFNIAKSFGLDRPEGALITEVVKDSPAEKGGLKAEDIILKVNNTQVRDVSMLRNAIFLMSPGSTATLAVLRNNAATTVKVTLGNLDDGLAEHIPQQKTPYTHHDLGIEVDNLTPDIANRLGYTNDHGVVITKVDPTGAGAIAGLKKGILIMAVNRKKVESLDQYQAALKDTKSNEPILLQIKQGKLIRYLSILTE